MLNFVENVERKHLEKIYFVQTVEQNLKNPKDKKYQLAQVPEKYLPILLH